MHVRYFYRKRQLSFSIERVFDEIRKALPGNVRHDDWRCPFLRANPPSVLANIAFVLFARAEVNHITGDVYYLALGLPRRNLVVTMHDARILLCLPGLRRAIFRRLWFEWPCSRARFVVFISEASQRELETALGHPIPNARVIPNPASPEFQYAPKAFNTARPRILLIGTKTNKNIERTARALEGIPCTVQVIGKLSEPQRAQLDASRIDYVDQAGLTGDQVKQAYIDCDLLCFASTYEGFGVPIIEAQSVGRPVVTSAVEPMSGVAGDAAVLVDPLDVDSIRQGVLRVIGDAALRERLVASGLRNKDRFAPEAIAGMYVDLYREIAGDEPREQSRRPVLETVTRDGGSP